jgi:hypothetical protein
MQFRQLHPLAQALLANTAFWLVAIALLVSVLR